MTRLVSWDDKRSMAELTRAVFGAPLTMDEAFAVVENQEPSRTQPVAGDHEAAKVWVGSVGYERFKFNGDFASKLLSFGVERLIDVRELPISRRRGYAKTALGEAMRAVNIEYVHMRALGNPKAYRDLYKSGQVAEGRARYERFVLEERRDALVELVGLLRERPSALMCVEHDPATCHRTVIFHALRDELDVDIDIADIA
jgi:uncharacterized protein (DUF488 family)